MKFSVIAALSVGASISGQVSAQATPPQQLGMGEAVAFGLKNSPALRGSQAEIAAARAESGTLRSRTRPQLSVNGFASLGTMANILQSAAGVEPQALIIAPDRGFVDANLTLMAPLYTGGYLSGLVAAAIALERAAIADASGMRSEVALRIRQSYARALYGAELLTAQQARLNASEAMVGNAKARLDAGKDIEASVRRAEAERAEAQLELTIAENDRRKMLLDLLAEMGATLDAPVTLTTILSLNSPALNLQGSLTAADKTRGELIASRQRIRAAKSQVSAAEGTLRPQVYGFAMADAYAPSDLMRKNSGYTVGLTVSLPVFDGGMRRSEIAKARAMLEKAEAEGDRWKLQVQKEVRQAWLDIETAAQNYKTAQASSSAALAAYNVMVIRVETGKSILLEQLDALATLTKARSNVSLALYEHEVAIARLRRAIGEADGESAGGEGK